MSSLAAARDYRSKEDLQLVAFCGGATAGMEIVLTNNPPAAAKQSDLDGAIEILKVSTDALLAYVGAHQQAAGLTDADAVEAVARGVDTINKLTLAQDGSVTSISRTCIDLAFATHGEDAAELRAAFARAEATIRPLLAL